MRQFLSGCRHQWVWPGAIALLFAYLAAHTGTDANWDLRNYHLYNGHALLSGRFWTDIAPAQLQTFYAPMLDIAIGAIRDRLNDTPVLLNIVLAIPHALAVWLAFLLTLRAIPADLPGRALLALAAALFSAAGASGLPTLASSLDDTLLASCTLGGLLLLTADTDRPIARAAWAGALSGVAAALKLTTAPYCVAAVVALALAPGRPGIGRVRLVATFVAGGLVAGALVGGPWWVTMYLRYRDPIFPFMNQIFHSPFVARLPFTDQRFKPRTLVQVLFFPFFWATHRTAIVSELQIRDPRFALAYIAVLVTLIGMILPRLGSARGPGRSLGASGLDRNGRLLVVFFAIGFALWELQFSIFRYLATLELLIGAILLLALRPLLSRPGVRIPTAVGFVALCAAVQMVTVYPDWGHMPSPRPMRVSLPSLPLGSMVVLLDTSPMAYVADAAPPAIRFVGANNNLIHPGQSTLLAREAETAIRSHAGPLYGLEEPNDTPGMADRTLAWYGLRRDGCAPVVSNLDDNAIRLCRLRRVGG